MSTAIVDQDTAYHPSNFSQIHRIKGYLVRLVGITVVFGSAFASIYPFLSSNVPGVIVAVYLVMGTGFSFIEAIGKSTYDKAVQKGHKIWAVVIALAIFIITLTDACGVYGYIKSAAENARNQEDAQSKIDKIIEKSDKETDAISSRVTEQANISINNSRGLTAIGRFSKSNINAQKLDKHNADQFQVINQRKNTINLIKDNVTKSNPILETHSSVAGLFRTTLSRVNKIFSAIIAISFVASGVILCGYKTDEEEYESALLTSVRNKEADLRSSVRIAKLDATIESNILMINNAAKVNAATLTRDIDININLMNAEKDLELSKIKKLETKANEEIIREIANSNHVIDNALQNMDSKNMHVIEESKHVIDKPIHVIKKNKHASPQVKRVYTRLNKKSLMLSRHYQGNILVDNNMFKHVEKHGIHVISEPIHVIDEHSERGYQEMLIIYNQNNNQETRLNLPCPVCDNPIKDSRSKFCKPAHRDKFHNAKKAHKNNVIDIRKIA